jgi:hypothetical protein
VLALTLKDTAASKLFYEGNDSSFQAGVMVNFFAISKRLFFAEKYQFLSLFAKLLFRLVTILRLNASSPAETHETQISSLLCVFRIASVVDCRSDGD